MNRRAFLTGLLAAAAAPALPAQAGPLNIEITAFGIPETQLQWEIARRVAEHWQRQLQHAFVLQMEQCWK